MTTAAMIDLRSDTITRPTPGMRAAIAGAAVGDDVRGEDPSVNALEDRVAALLGVEACLFVPSGTMGNLVSLASATMPGDEVLLNHGAHIFNHEVAHTAVVAGLQLHPLGKEDGTLDAGEVEAHIRGADLHAPRTRVVALENTHNRAGGRIFPLDRMQAIRSLADRRGLHVHVDGARLAHAVVATGIPFTKWVACADTVSMCFSKGLGAPVGSIVGSRKEIIDVARRKRKMLGGGMRQAGVLAAAATYALDHHIDRLADDHRNAKRLAELISTAEGLEVIHPVETNIVIFSVDRQVYGDTSTFITHLRDQGVAVGACGPALVRAVTHLDVTAEDVERAGAIIASAAGIRR